MTTEPSITRAFNKSAEIARKFIASDLGKREARLLAISYWGAVLFELRYNITQAQQMTGPGSERSYGLFTLRAWDSLFEPLFKLTPMPRMLSTLQEVNEAFREISSLLRVAVGVPAEIEPMGSLGSLVHDQRSGGHQWHDARLQANELLPNAILVFKHTRDIIEDVAREAFNRQEWQAFADEMLPKPIET